jgi:hypothetical protein
MRSKRWRRRVTILGAAVVMVGVAVGVAIALPGTTVSGGPLMRVKVVRETVAQTTNSTAWTNLPAAATSLRVPRRQQALVLARFSAETSCSTGTHTDRCSVRILIKGAEGEPAAGTDFAFDSNTGTQNREAHSMDRTRVLGPGSYTVRVQWRVTNAAVNFTLDDWSLVVEQFRKR